MLISFSHDLHCLNLLREAVSVRRTILVESSSSKLSSSRLKTFLATSTNFHQLLPTFTISFRLWYYFDLLDIHQSHHTIGCHATGIDPLLIFFTCFALFISVMPRHMSDMNNCKHYFYCWFCWYAIYIYPQSWSTKFSNKLIASDLLISWISRDIAMLLILRKPLQTILNLKTNSNKPHILVHELITFVGCPQGTKHNMDF